MGAVDHLNSFPNNSWLSKLQGEIDYADSRQDTFHMNLNIYIVIEYKIRFCVHASERFFYVQFLTDIILVSRGRNYPWLIVSAKLGSERSRTTQVSLYIYII